VSNLAPHLTGLGGEGEDVAAGPLEALGDGGQPVVEPVHQYMHRHHPAAPHGATCSTHQSPQTVPG
jgi:hypothetical protein